MSGGCNVLVFRAHCGFHSVFFIFLFSSQEPGGQLAYLKVFQNLAVESGWVDKQCFFGKSVSMSRYCCGCFAYAKSAWNANLGKACLRPLNVWEKAGMSLVIWQYHSHQSQKFSIFLIPLCSFLPVRGLVHLLFSFPQSALMPEPQWGRLCHVLAATQLVEVIVLTQASACSSMKCALQHITGVSHKQLSASIPKKICGESIFLFSTEKMKMRGRHTGLAKGIQSIFLN